MCVVPLGTFFGVMGLVLPVFASDPPHDGPSNSIECITCHVPHGAAGGSLTQADGNPNLCMSCHTPAGMASARSFADTDQAIPGVIGTSHRWDSGPSGHVTAHLANASTGTVSSGGQFTGRIEKAYNIVISVPGNTGLAAFDWDDGEGGSGTGVATGDEVILADGLVLRFRDGTASPAFLDGDFWVLRVRTDLRLPHELDTFERPMWQRLTGLARLPDRSWDSTHAKVVCSVCHDQHSQRETPFDVAAPPYSGAGTGEGRFFQRRVNDVNQMCKTCHESRDVTTSDAGSHPVSVTIPAGQFQTPSNLPLDEQSQVQCMSCHAPHRADSGGANNGAGDGYLLRLSMGDTCEECHTLADTVAGSHFGSADGVLWPGGQYGSSFSAHSAEKRGWCINCHWPHGWPDDDDPVKDFPRLWVEQYDVMDDHSDPDDAEDLCYTCHDGTPALTDIRADFLKGQNGTDIFHHPVADSEQSAGRSVECTDCHNPHEARPDNRFAGVSGVNLDGTVTSLVTEAEQYKLCFKCHGDTYNQSRPMTSNKRSDFATDNSAYHPVVQAGRNQSQNLADQLAASGSGLTTSSTIRCTDCHNSNATASSQGPVVDSDALTQGPHGSNHAPILRANLNRNYTQSTAPSSYNANNYELCFLCHDETSLMARDRDDGARTNFYDDINGKDNLHWVHLDDRADKARATCSNCHFDIHSNVSADNTQYRINGTLYSDNAAVTVARYKTHMVNFSPDVQSYNEDGVNRAKPEWWLNTSNRQRRCYLACHGENMTGNTGDGGPRAQYRPPAGDELIWDY